MGSACLFTALLEYPGSPIRQGIDSAFVRRLLTGIVMGLTAISIIYSPWGRRSGAHVNPAVTFTFFRLGKVQRWDATFYAASQFVGATAGVLLAALITKAVSDPAVNYAVTIPGPNGLAIAGLAEFVIAAGLMTMILYTSNHRLLSRYTGVFAGTMVALYITLEAPLSGMSMNPARTFGSALPAGVWTGFGIYLLAPLTGMLTAAQGYLWLVDKQAVGCAKLQHNTNQRCIFCGANGGFAA
jgi:aquaporin Z